MVAAPESFGAESPSGENLEYEQVFTDLQLAAQFGEERQSGDHVIPGQEPDPAEIVEKAEAVLARSHDLRAAVLLAYGGLRLHGFAGLADATAYIRACLEDYWDTCHPTLDAEDNDDPTMRVNALLGLVDSRMTLRATRMAPLTDSPSFGRMSMRDIEIARGEIAPPADMEAPPDATRISAAFQDTPDEALSGILDAARNALDNVRAIDALFDEKVPGQGPRLDPLIQVLRRVVGRLTEEIGTAEAEPENQEDAVSMEPVATGPSTRDPSPGEIRSRNDVERAIDSILAYYGRSEPSSPVPILLIRAKKLVGADFMTIVNEIAPGGADNVKLIGGFE